MKRCNNLQAAVQALFTKYKGTKYYLVAEQIKWPGGRLYEDLEAEETLDTISQISRDPEKFGFKKPVYVNHKENHTTLGRMKYNQGKE